MEKVKKNNGITLVALIVTIILLLILASISIGTITGDNSIIQNAIKAKEQAEINNEKEQLEMASTEAIGKDKYGNLSKNGLIDQLDKIREQMPTDVIGEGILYVEYTNTHRFYEVETDGNIDYVGDIESAKSKVRIEANPESNSTPLLVQEVGVTITTAMEYENDELTIHYGWTTDDTTEPEEYDSTAVNEIEKTNKRKINVSSSRYGTEGNYYLWVKVKILETGKETIEKFGPYAVKENTMLIKAESSEVEAYFLNGNLKRNQIKRITILDSLQGHTPTEDRVCWDVSTNNSGKILAWYEQIPDSEFYAVTIAQNGGVVANSNCEYLFTNIGHQDDISGEWTPTILEGFSNFDTSKVTSMYHMFAYMNTLQELDLHTLDTSKLKGSLYFMFCGCSNIERLDLRGVDTHKVTNMNSIFNGCRKLRELKIDNNKFVTDNVLSFTNMFKNCYELENLDVSKWNTSKIETMPEIFYGCRKLKKLNMSNWDTSNVTKMNRAFEGCTSLTSLDLSSFNTSNVTNMEEMFDGDTSLETLNLSSFDTSKITVTKLMFRNCNVLQYLNISNFDFSNVTDYWNMFTNVPTTVQIITNESAKSWLNEKFPSYTNIIVQEN